MIGDRVCDRDQIFVDHDKRSLSGVGCHTMSCKITKAIAIKSLIAFRINNRLVIDIKLVWVTRHDMPPERRLRSGKYIKSVPRK